MKKFIRYLYEYQNERRVQNVGFVRVEESEDSAVIQIYGKGFPATADQTLEIFLFYPKDGQCIGIPVGHIRGMRPMSGYRLDVRDEDVGGKDIFKNLNGVILKNEVNGRFRWSAAIWDESPVNVEQMVMQEEIKEEKPAVEEPLTEQPEESRMEQSQESVSSEPEETVEENQNMIYKVTRQDLAKLTRQEWKLANNHFLMHGYRNFHHLISFSKDGEYWLGVPGIYHPQEQRAANAFGFGQFMRPEEGEIALTEEEQSSQGEFGYWCRIVSNLIRN